MLRCNGCSESYMYEGESEGRGRLKRLSGAKQILSNIKSFRVWPLGLRGSAEENPDAHCRKQQQHGVPGHAVRLCQGQGCHLQAGQQGLHSPPLCGQIWWLYNMIWNNILNYFIFPLFVLLEKRIKSNRQRRGNIIQAWQNGSINVRMWGREWGKILS